MKIGYISLFSYRDDYGGAIRFKDFADKLSEKHEFTWISCQPSKKNVMKYKNGLIEKTLTFPPILNSIIERLVGALVITCKLFRIARSDKFDVLIVHHPSMIAGFPSIVTGKLLRIPVIMDYHDIDILTPIEKFVQDTFVIKRSDYIMVVSTYLRTRVQNMGFPQDKITYLPHTFRPIFSRKASIGRAEIRKKYKINKNAILVIYIGSIKPDQGLLHLIHSLPLVLSKNKNVHYIIVGRPAKGCEEEYKNIKASISKLKLGAHTTLTGHVPRHKLLEILKASDIAVIPKNSSKFNEASFPTKMFEYLSAGLPLIVTNVGVMKDIIQNGVTGLIVKPDSPEDLSRAIISLINNKELRKRIAKNGKELVKEEYSVSKITNRIENVLEKINSVP